MELVRWDTRHEPMVGDGGHEPLLNETIVSLVGISVHTCPWWRQGGMITCMD